LATIDLSKGKMAVREARDRIKAGISKGFKLHSTAWLQSPAAQAELSSRT